MTALSSVHRSQWRADGFTVLRGILPISLLANLKSRIGTQIVGHRVSEVARDVDAAVLTAFRRNSTCHQLPFVELGESAFDLLFDEAIFRVATSLLGTEIELNATQHVRVKLPTRTYVEVVGRPDPDVVPWHQDAFSGDPLPRACDMATFWVPLVPVHSGNGTLGLFEGSHHAGPVDDNQAGITCGLVEGEPRWILADPGDIVVFHKHIIHGSSTNRSKSLRWSVDFRIQAAGAFSGRNDAANIPFLSHEEPNRRPSLLSSWFAQQRSVCSLSRGNI